MQVEIDVPIRGSSKRIPATGWVILHPEREAWFRDLGLITAKDFLTLPGIIVSGHPTRHVMRVELSDGDRTMIAYLKKEHRVSWKDRFRHWRDGFGWASKSNREGILLQHLEAKQLPCPQWLAYGEDDSGRAFLLIESKQKHIESRTFLRQTHEMMLTIDLAKHLGNKLAEIHNAGFSHPDLYAKHLLIDLKTWEFTILDWQRSKLPHSLTISERTDTLAALDATLSDSLVSRWFRFRVLREYWNHLPNAISFRELVQKVEDKSQKLLCRKSIRAQRESLGDEVSHTLVWIDGEAICCIPEIENQLQDPESQRVLYDLAGHGKPIRLSSNRIGYLRITEYGMSWGRLWAWFRGIPWRSPEMILVRKRFEAQRLGKQKANILAFGQREERFGKAKAFILFDGPLIEQ
jgi:tRNA A-37 threonylcarbamoyl transferase component Bud32